MDMTAAEILKNYREAKDKKRQVRILADMNVCTIDEIKAILIAGGIDKRELPRTRQKTATETNDPKFTATARQLSVITTALQLYREQILQESKAAKNAHEEHMAKLSEAMAEVDRILEMIGN